MSSSLGGTSLPHRALSSIRGGGQGVPPSPQTPTRPGPSLSFSSPSNLRADEDIVVVELGSRTLRVGFAGDSAPKRTASFSPDQQRRTGDFRPWNPNYGAQWRQRDLGKPWGGGHELWQLDIRGQDLALVQDKLERELREALTKYLLMDSKPRKMTLVLPPTLPLPLLSSVLDTIFHRFQSPTISLLSSPVMTAMSAGTRSALVIDLGWHETTVTSVYEFKEVQTWRTVRAGKMLIEETHDLLTRYAGGQPAEEDPHAKKPRDVVSFDECEEVARRMLWCKRPDRPHPADISEGLPTVQEHDELEIPEPAEDQTPFSVQLNSCQPPKRVKIPFAELTGPCEATFFAKEFSSCSFDDHELPVHLLVYRFLLQLPMDVRAVCMSRIIFTGGCSNIVGIKGRILDEVTSLSQNQGWDPVQGRAVEQLKTNPKLNRVAGRNTGPSSIPVIVESPTHGGEGEETTRAVDPAHAGPEPDQVEEMVKRDKGFVAPIQGSLRVVDSLGPWCGASMAAQLKVAALAVVERELWMQHGVLGACKPSEVDVKIQQRQSMGAGGLMRGQGTQPNNWTLGVWGAI